MPNVKQIHLPQVVVDQITNVTMNTVDLVKKNRQERLLGDRKNRAKDAAKLNANFKSNYCEKTSKDKRKQDAVSRVKSSRSTLIENSRKLAD